MDRQLTETGFELGKWIGGALAGAALMYILDPERGSARRARSGERLRHLGRQAEDKLENTWERSERLGHEAADSTREMANEMRPDRDDWRDRDDSRGRNEASRLGREASDEASRLGREASQSFSRITREAGDAVSRLGHATSEGIRETASRARASASHASERLRHTMHDIREGGEWDSATRNSAMLGGGLLGLFAFMRRSPLSTALGVLGLALLARGATNQPVRKMIYRSSGTGRPVHIEKSIYIDASPREVYDAWENVENFPRFMSNVIDVHDLGGRRSHWVVRGPAGSRLEWDSVMTEKSRPHRLAWRTEPGAEIPQTGSIELEPYRGGTRATVRMSYSPPGGKLGHGLASLIGSDPKSQMDDDLERMKSIIERGDAHRHGSSHDKHGSRFLH